MATEPLVAVHELVHAHGRLARSSRTHDALRTHSGNEPFTLNIDRFSLHAGEACACIGPSGSGKTTLLNLIAGIVTPARGRLSVLGHDLCRAPAAVRRALRLSRVGLVFQEFELLEYLSVRENITLVRRLGRLDASALEARAATLAAAAGINHLLSRLPARLSQGERQRVAVCRALATGPALLLCDEPTGNLDPELGLVVTALLLDQARASGAALLMVTHNHALLPTFDRVVSLAVTRAHGQRAAHLTEGVP